MSTKKYDVALSYASEDEDLVKRVYKILTENNFKVFFAPEKIHKLVGKDRIKEFYSVFRHQSYFVVAFVSKSYLKKDITILESDSAISKNKEEKTYTLIPIYLDDSKLPNLDKDIVYLRSTHCVEIASIVKERISENSERKKAKPAGHSSKSIEQTIIVGEINNGFTINN